jgi:hypothetical protein
MSKQSEAKKRQGYVKKSVPQVCMNCKQFISDKVPYSYNPAILKEVNKRCVIGGFAVMKTATCDLFESKTNEETNQAQPES